MSPKPVRTAKRAFWLTAHWKIALVLAVIIAPLLITSYSRCSKTRDGCSLFELLAGTVRIVVGWFT